MDIIGIDVQDFVRAMRVIDEIAPGATIEKGTTMSFEPGSDADLVLNFAVADEKFTATGSTLDELVAHAALLAARAGVGRVPSRADGEQDLRERLAADIDALTAEHGDMLPVDLVRDTILTGDDARW